jgi:hypothetical protein
MQVSVSDKDMFSAKELISFNLTSTFGAKELLGRTLIRLAPITSVVSQPHGWMDGWMGGWMDG